MKKENMHYIAPQSEPHPWIYIGGVVIGVVAMVLFAMICFAIEDGLQRIEAQREDAADLDEATEQSHAPYGESFESDWGAAPEIATPSSLGLLADKCAKVSKDTAFRALEGTRHQLN